MKHGVMMFAGWTALIGGVLPFAAVTAHDRANDDILPTAETSAAHILSTWARPETQPLPTAVPSCRQSGERLALPPLGHETSRFGLRSDPFGSGVRLHAGIDLAAPSGAPVVAAGGGEVLRAAWAAGYGNLVVIDHGRGLTTRYAHLQRSLVRVGQHVGTGQAIGLVGATGHATGSHLHFEIRLAGQALDPQTASALPCRDLVAMAPALNEVAAQSVWTTQTGNGVLPTAVIR
jgi:murein DD-endopeptidase MepM/ murein hydrolase activator NlpD